MGETSPAREWPPSGVAIEQKEKLKEVDSRGQRRGGAARRAQEQETRRKADRGGQQGLREHRGEERSARKPGWGRTHTHFPSEHQPLTTYLSDTLRGKGRASQVRMTRPCHSPPQIDVRCKPAGGRMRQCGHCLHVAGTSAKTTTPRMLSDPPPPRVSVRTALG